MASQPEDIIHIELDWDDDRIITISPSKDDWHPDARYWLPINNVDRYQTYLRLNKLPLLNCKKHLHRLIAGRIVQRTNNK